MSWRLLYWILGLIAVLPLFNLLLGIHPPTFKTDDDPSRYGLDYEPVSFKTKDGLTLRGWFIPGAPLRDGVKRGGCATILVGHGYPFDKANILSHALFLHPRFNLLFFDFRYFGESEGRYTTAGFLETRDVDAAVAFLKQREDVDPNRIGAMGFSMSAASFIMARHPDIGAIVSDSSYATLEGLIERQFFFFPGPTKWPFVALTELYAWLLLGVKMSDAAPADAVKHLPSPLFVIHGDEDSQIPVKHARQIEANANPSTTEVWIVQGADHGLAHAFAGPQYEIRIREFFVRHLCGVESRGSESPKS